MPMRGGQDTYVHSPLSARDVAVGEGGVGVRRVDDLLGDAPLVEIRVDGELEVRLDGRDHPRGGLLATLQNHEPVPDLELLRERLHVVSAHTIVSCSLVAELGITTSAVAGPNLSAPVPSACPEKRNVVGHQSAAKSLVAVWSSVSEMTFVTV